MNAEELREAREQAAALQEQVRPARRPRAPAPRPATLTRRPRPGPQVDALPDGVVKRTMEQTLSGLRDRIRRAEDAHARSEWELISAADASDGAAAASGPPDLQPVIRMLESCPSVPSAHHAVAAALHALVLQAGYVCTGSDAGATAVPGFAPPVRDLPPRQFLPAGWSAGSGGEVQLRYRHAEDRRAVLKSAFGPAGGGGAFRLTLRHGAAAASLEGTSPSPEGPRRAPRPDPRGSRPSPCPSAAAPASGPACRRCPATSAAI